MRHFQGDGYFKAKFGDSRLPSPKNHLTFRLHIPGLKYIKAFNNLINVIQRNNVQLFLPWNKCVLGLTSREAHCSINSDLVKISAPKYI